MFIDVFISSGHIRTSGFAISVRKNVFVTLEHMGLEPIPAISRVPCPACCSMREISLELHGEGSQSWQ